VPGVYLILFGEQRNCKATGHLTFTFIYFLRKKEIWDMRPSGTPIQKLLNLRTSYQVDVVPGSKTHPAIGCPEVFAVFLNSSKQLLQ
jgi:hypothetical protein